MARSQSTDTGPEAFFTIWQDMTKAALGPMAGASTKWLEGLSDLNAEVMSFLAERIQEDVKTQHALLHCKSLAEVQHVQMEFVQKALDQYQAETGKLIEMSSTVFHPDADKT